MKTKAKAKRLTKAQIRVQIAKDVIRQLDANRIVADGGCYLDADEFEEQIDGAADVPDGRYLAAPKDCRACAIGSVFVCALDRFNELKLHKFVDDGGGSDAMVRYLSPWFTRAQLRLMEIGFQEYNSDPGAVTDRAADAAYAWHEKRLGSDGECDYDAIMRALMKNVIRNNGTFKP